MTSPGAHGEGEGVPCGYAVERTTDGLRFGTLYPTRVDADTAATPSGYYRVVPLYDADVPALLARANTAKVAADLMRARAEKAERFLSMLFESHWDGTIGRPPTWRLRGDFRHILAGMRGETLEAAIEALGREGA